MTQEIKRRIEQINCGEVPQGYKKTAVGIVPAEWQKVNLNTLLEFKNGINAEKGKFGTGIKMISVMDILENEPIYYSTIKGSIDIDADTLEKYCVNFGDILFQRSSETFDDAGKSNVYLDEEHTATYSGFVIRGKKISDYDPSYLNELLKTQSIRKQVIRLSAGSQHINIGQDALSEIVLNMSKIDEQHDISEVLSKWVEAVSLQKKLIEKLELQKKALIQKLLTPKKGWNPVSLGEILKEASTKTEIINQYPTISSTKKGLFLQSEYFDKDVASEDNVGYKVLKLGQIVLSPQNLWLGNINFNNKYEFGMVSPSYKIFDISENCNRVLISTIMQTPRMLYQYVLSSEQGASVVRRNLNMDLFNQIVIHLPIIDKQNCIANQIEKFNTLFELETQKLDKLKQQQKAMQQLLLTGIVRVS
ncbi:MAG: hypothetical protein CVU91_04165 [Firmicutes bacterium HGW-Firmicutes-16]|nr:MAG: hypothetical protein CVU91_04165 [Firmicutes bacterium HGW-Firmicutes-16]